MLTKVCPAMIKGTDETGGLEEGQFTAVVSVFGNKDVYGDVVKPGAFKDSLIEWEKSGNPIPCYYSHRMDDPDYNIGWVIDADEVDEGLRVKVQLDLEHGKGHQVYRLLKGKRLTQFSFAYDVIESAWEDQDGEEVRALKRLKLHEVGPTPIGANPATELIDVKSAAEEAIRYSTFLTSDPTLIDAIDLDRLRKMRDKFSDTASLLSGVMDSIKSDDAQVEESGQPQQPAEREGTDHAEPATVPTASGPSSTGVDAGRLAALSILTLESERS